MNYCPKCRKYVNTRTQTFMLKGETNITTFCEVCGMTIENNIERHPLNDDIDIDGISNVTKHRKIKGEIKHVKTKRK